MNLKTPITYYGGKQKLVSRILPLLPDHDIYCEPFLGSAAVFMAKNPSKSEIINDLDAMISIFYRVVQTDFESLKQRIESTLYDRTIHRVAWSIRQIPHHFSDLQVAWAFYVLTGTGFSGTLDSFGCYTQGTKAKTFHNKRLLWNESLRKRFEGVQIENTDALELIERRDTNRTFFYLDPPYIDTVQGHYKGYTREHYTELLKTLTKLKGKFLLSSFPNDILDGFIEDYDWYSISVDQSKPASRNQDGTKKRKTEMLVANYEINN
ncbi:MAG: DNA adenine methylase [bacterium]|nr:DNA adenine methylase [bacterium]